MVARGIFRRDLYYRLRGLTIHIPPLRERGDEIQHLTDHFLRNISEERGRRFEVTEDARAALLTNPWEGNVRELVQCLEAAAVRARDGVIDRQALLLRSEPMRDSVFPSMGNSAADDGPSYGDVLSMPVQSNSDGRCYEKSYSEMMDEYEKSLLQKTLDACGGNVSRAASLLKMSAITMRRRIRVLGVERRSYFVTLPFATRGQSFQVREDIDKAV
jgi:two-component system nitrogen regulation response regulator GlnG